MLPLVALVDALDERADALLEVVEDGARLITCA